MSTLRYAIRYDSGYRGWQAVVFRDGVRIDECAHGHETWEEAAGCGQQLQKRVQEEIGQCS